ncbi:MAG: cytochrome P450 [Solirubrobacterales bacterium]|nr:cytochrome P450 [Solirubrobacterales bacterium]
MNQKPLPPGPKGLDAARFLINTTRDFKQPMMDMALEYGEVAHVRNRRRDFMVVSGHEAARHVLITNQDNYRKGLEYELLRIVLGDGLLTSEGETWRQQRRLVQPMFAKRYLKNFTAHMTQATAEVLESEQFANLPDGETVDVSEVMMALTLDIVGRALFGADLSGETARKVGPAMNDVLSLGTKMSRRLPTFVLAHLPGMNLEKAMSLNPEGRRFQAALADLKSVIDEMLEERSRQDHTGDDLVGVMLSARDEETGETMSREQIGDELMTFMLAGHETTSNALAWTWRRLSLNPAVRERLFEEVDTVLGDRIPDMDDMDRLPWTRACVEEAMRLDSPVWTVGRQAIEEDEILGYRIPAGSSVMVLISMIHRDPRVWPNPEGYDPNRFLPENTKGRPRQAYMPFGAGRRVCVGSTFATVEATLLAAMISRKLRFDMPSGAETEAEAVITLRPKNGLPMHVFHRRHEALEETSEESDLAAV